MRKSYKGLFKPVYPDKYVGDPKGIVYRSLLEKRFMLYCDKNIDITNWASEEVAIRYFNPITKKHHRYFPDFIIKTSKNKKYVIEIKPYRQCKPLLFNLPPVSNGLISEALLFNVDVDTAFVGILTTIGPLLLVSPL